MGEQVAIIGGGLAGCEAAWQLASRGIETILFEMRPRRTTAAHRTGRLAELVCSNSLKSDSLERAPGLLKEEMRLLGSLIVRCADASAVPAGQALAVDRDAFAAHVEAALAATGLVTVVREEVRTVREDGITIVATGPLTSDNLAADLRRVVGEDFLHFYDAVSPIVAADSVDRSIAFAAARYDKGVGKYLNCPMAREEYVQFVDSLLAAEVAGTREIAPSEFFEGCLPIEEMARRHPDALRFGPLKPVGLTDPRTGRRPYACVQLRTENHAGTMYNLVGCQTGLEWVEQERLVRMVPGLADAEILRYGVMHRNLFLNGPKCLDAHSRLRGCERLFLAGQMTGVEGYVESALSGVYVGLNATRLAQGEPVVVLPPETLAGALMQHVSSSPSADFQPMNANFGLLPPVENVPKKLRRQRMVERALAVMAAFRADHAGLLGDG